MKSFGSLIAFFAVLVFVLPSLTAQDEKKDAEKVDKKTEEKKDDKKDPEKKDDKKDPEKKEEKKAVEKLVFGAKFVTKVVSIKAESNRELSIEMKEVDPKKVYDNNVWSQQRQQALTQRQQGLAKSQQNIFTQKDAKARFNAQLQYQKDVAAYQNELATYQNELAKRGQNIYTAKTVEVQAAEMCKVRAMVPPLEFDDTGNEKKYTKKELDDMRDKTGLPGFPADFDAIKSGQTVEIYMAKAVPKKAVPPKKKGPDDDDPPEMKMARPEFVLIVILPGGPR